MHDPSFSHRRARLGCRGGTFSPSRRQIRFDKERRKLRAGIEFALSDKWGRNNEPALPDDEPADKPRNELEKFFFARAEGHGIWKWQHYFEVYDNFFRPFRGRPAHVLEIGIYSGGSLELWRDYFG